jgi:thiamine biosynthesis lipoprotein
MKKGILLLLVCALLLAGCAGQTAPEKKQYTATFLTLFDTVTSIVGKADSEEVFRETAQTLHDELLEYHQLFDIYNTYEGINNLKTVNDNAGGEPVAVDRRIIDLLLDCKAYHDATGGKVNAAMGSVLYLWHEARNDSLNDPANAYLPDLQKLEAAGEDVFRFDMTK